MSVFTELFEIYPQWAKHRYTNASFLELHLSMLIMLTSADKCSSEGDTTIFRDMFVKLRIKNDLLEELASALVMV